MAAISWRRVAPTNRRQGALRSLAFFRRLQLRYRRLQSLCASDQIGQKALVNFRAALVFGQVSLVVRLEGDLHVSPIRTDGMNEGLEDSDPIF